MPKAERGRNIPPTECASNEEDFHPQKRRNPLIWRHLPSWRDFVTAIKGGFKNITRLDLGVKVGCALENDEL